MCSEVLTVTDTACDQLSTTTREHMEVGGSSTEAFLKLGSKGPRRGVKSFRETKMRNGGREWRSKTCTTN
jgi:hypothetical protein